MKYFKQLGLFAVVGLTSCENEVVEEQVEPVRPVRATEVSSFEDYGKRRFPGRASAKNAVTLAFEVPGKLIKFPAQLGDYVKKGDVLAQLDQRDFENALEQARAELKRAEAQFSRMKRAAEARAVAAQDVTNAEAAFLSAQAQLKIREKALADTQLIAPYDGIVSAEFVKEFSSVLAKQSIVRLVDPSQIEMVADVPEDIISMAKEGMKISVRFDAFPDVTVTARISEIGSEASESTRTYPVTLLMNQPEGATILPGMSGAAWRAPETKPENTPLSQRGYDVPLTSIFSGTDGLRYVWVIDPVDHTVHQKAVELGELSRGGILVQGLDGGEIIATAGVHSLHDGQKVRIIN
jgi:RND family efflux transporter MFP subunit